MNTKSLTDIACIVVTIVLNPKQVCNKPLAAVTDVALTDMSKLVDVMVAANDRNNNALLVSAKFTNPTNRKIIFNSNGTKHLIVNVITLER
jgi:hypothetical protein